MQNQFLNNEFLLQSLYGRTPLGADCSQSLQRNSVNLFEHRGKPDPEKVAAREAMRKRGEERRKNAEERRKEEEAARRERQKLRAEKQRQQKYTDRQNTDKSQQTFNQQSSQKSTDRQQKVKDIINKHSSKISEASKKSVAESSKYLDKIQAKNDTQKKIVNELDKTVGSITDDIDKYKETLMTSIEKGNADELPRPQEAINAIVMSRYGDYKKTVSSYSIGEDYDEDDWEDEYDEDDFEDDWEDEGKSKKSSNKSKSSKSSSKSGISGKSYVSTSTKSLLNNAKVEKYTDKKLKEAKKEAENLKDKYKDIIDGIKSKTDISDAEKEELINAELNEYAKQRDKIKSKISKFEDAGIKGKIAYFATKHFKAATKPFISISNAFDKLLDAASPDSTGWRNKYK